MLQYNFVIAWKKLAAAAMPGHLPLLHRGNDVRKDLRMKNFHRRLAAALLSAVLLATVLRTREACMPAFVFTSVPFLFLSGISWPQASVPLVWKIVGWFVPSTSGIQGFIKIDSMGACLADVRFEYLSLWALTLLYGVLAYAAYERIGRRLPAVSGGGK